MTTKLRSFLALAALAAFVPAVALSADAARSVVCKDGSTAEGGRGACRGHGGVDKSKSQGGTTTGVAEDKASKAQEKAEKKAKKAEEKAAKQADKEKGKAEEAAGAASVTCKDGSTSKGGRGACRGHGGEDKAATARSQGGAATAMPSAPAAPATPPAAAAPAAPPAPNAPSAPSARAPAKVPAAAGVQEKADPSKGPATARCKDGSLSYAKHHTGACSRHGGVAEWLDNK